MTRVLVVWEDDYCEPLADIVRRVVRSSAPSADAEVPIVLRHTARSNGAFERYARVTWPAVKSRGLPMDSGPIDHLVCVVDADRLHELRPTELPPVPADTELVGPWHTAAEHAWRDFLRGACDPGGPPRGTVHGVVLRWAKESLLLAGYDEPATEVHLNVAADHPDVSAELGRCVPNPRDVVAAQFTDTFRHPRSCLSLLRKARGLGPLHKSAPEIDDALRALRRGSLPKITERVPDLARIASLVWSLHRGETEPAAGGKAEPAGRESRTKKRNRPRF